jgi:hypothetical protein
MRVREEASNEQLPRLPLASTVKVTAMAGEYRGGRERGSA